MDKSILFILPSWENRSYLGINKALSDGSKYDIIYLLKFTSPYFKEEVNQTIDKIKKLSSERAIKVIEVGFERNDLSAWREFSNIFSNISTDSNVSIDITTMPRNIIWILLCFLKNYFTKVKIIYNKPKKYTNDWVSRDPTSPELLLKHSGIMDISKKLSLFILPGYDKNRVIQLVNFYEPSKVCLFFQEGTQFQNDIRNEKKYYLDLWNFQLEEFDIDVYSKDGGLSIIETEVIKIKEEYNIIFSSLGPKIGAIPVYQSYILHPEIALAYIPCKEYNRNYCTDIGETIVRPIDF